MIGILAAEGIHHLVEGPFVVRDCAGGGESIGDAKISKVLFQLSHHDLAKRHRRCADLSTDDFELASDSGRGLGHNRIRHKAGKIFAFGDARYDRHQVGLAASVVAHNQNSLIIRRCLEVHLRYEDRRQAFGQLVGNDERLYELPGGIDVVRVEEIHYCLNRFKLNKIAVFHSFNTPSYLRWH